MKYKEPPLKFEPALMKHVPDLPQKIEKVKGDSDTKLWVVLLITAIVLVIMAYFTIKFANGP